MEIIDENSDRNHKWHLAIQALRNQRTQEAYDLSDYIEDHLQIGLDPDLHQPCLDLIDAALAETPAGDVEPEPELIADENRGRRRLTASLIKFANI